MMYNEGKKFIFTVRLAKYVIDGFAASLMQSYINDVKNANIFHEKIFFIILHPIMLCNLHMQMKI